MRLKDESRAPATVRRLQLWSTLGGAVPVWDKERTVLRDMLLLGYCAAVGFVAAGVAASLYKLVTSENARFSLLGNSWAAAVSTFLFFALTGPAIIMQNALKRTKPNTKPYELLLASLLVAALWSVCSGIVVVELALSIRDSFA